RLRLYMTPDTDSLIDGYITSRQLPDSSDDCEPEFNNLLDQICDIERGSPQNIKQGIIKDIDSLFKTKSDQLVYVELKYNDDHDTGKFVDINRKFIKTWAGLVNILDIQNRHELQPILYYLNPTKRYGPIYTPSSNIMRGAQLFDVYFEIRYQDVDRYLHDLGEDPEIMEIFDNLYKRVRYGPV
ncbi:restriction endonuclease, partial [bacterium]|nr:restriction endonuclease [bacterium]